MNSERKGMGRMDFVELLKNTYPELFNSDADHGFNIIRGFNSVPDFITAYNIPPSNKEYTSYRDVWDYICANEDKHDWWML